MPSPGYRSLLIGAQADGTAGTSTTENSLLSPTSKFTLPANYIDFIGKKFIITAHGRISNIVTTPGTLVLKVKFGSIIAAASVALQLNAVAKTNVFWRLEWLLTARAIGITTAANFMHQGLFESESVVASPLPAAGGAGQFALQPATPVVGTGFDSTVANVIDLTGTFSLTGNSILVHDYMLESLN